MDFPTRGVSILDLVITRSPDIVSEVTEIGHFRKSDHRAVLYKVNVSIKLHQPNRETLNYSRADYTSMARLLSSVEWSRVLGFTSTFDSWSLVRAKLLNLEKQFVPLKKLKTRDKPVWMNQNALKAVEHRRHVYRKYRDSSHPAVITASRESRAAVAEARRNFELKLCQNIKTDTKSFFNYVNSGSRGQRSISKIVTDQGSVVDDVPNIADSFNRFFSSVFTKESPVDASMEVPTNRKAVLDDVSIEVGDVRKRLLGLAEGKSMGADDVSPHLLKNLGNELALPVSILFRKSLDESCVPQDWKIANVAPLFKKGSKLKVEKNFYFKHSLEALLLSPIESSQ